MRTLIASVAALALAASANAETPAAAPKTAVEVHPTGKPGTAGAARVLKLTATVKGVDAPNRVLILDVKGQTQNVKVGPAVKRFDEIAAGDTIAIAGKGHENVQIIGDRRLPFDDREAVRGLLAGAGAHDA